MNNVEFLIYTPWFWLVLMGAFVIIYAIISKICETIEHIKAMSNSDFFEDADNIQCKELKFDNKEDMDEFIKTLQKIQNNHSKEDE